MDEETKSIADLKKPRYRLFVKFGLISVLIMSLTIIGLATVSIYRQKAMFEKEWLNSKMIYANAAEASFGNALQLNDYAFLEEFNKRISQQDEVISSAVVDRDMVYLVHSDSTLMGENSENELIAQSMKEREAVVGFSEGSSGKRICSIAVPIIFAENVEGVGFIQFSTTHVDHMTGILYREFGMLAVIFLVLGVIGALFMARNVAKPVTGLADLADKVAKGDFNVKSSLNRSDELGFLGKAFNMMVKRLKIARDELEVARDNAERKLEFETVLGRISSEFLKEQDFDNAVTVSLEEIRKITGTDGCAMFLTNRENSTFSEVFKNLRDGIESHENELQDVGVDKFPWMVEQLKADRIIECTNPDELPGDAFALKEMLKKLEAPSVVLTPIHVGTSFAGFISISHREAIDKWPEELKPFMRLAASIIDTALERLRVTEIENKLEAQNMVVKELKELDRMKNEFVETVTHELRTPMTPLSSAVEMLITGMFGEINDKQKQYLEMMQRNIERLARFATDVLSLSRLESGKYPMNIEKLSVCSVIEPAVELLKKKAEERNSRITLDKMHDTHAFGDADAVNEVLTNIINNAIVHTNEGTDITVATRNNSGDFISIVVSDNGQGIEKEALEKIFDRFVQVGRKSGPGYRGSGIGLAVCKALVEKMGGSISVESKMGFGTTFTFTLPRKEPVPEEEAEKEKPGKDEKDNIITRIQKVRK